MLAYLFRDWGGTNAFAYTCDVTGRTLPPLTGQTRWVYVATADIRDDPKVLRHLTVRGFCIFETDRQQPSDDLRDPWATPAVDASERPLRPLPSGSRDHRSARDKCMR